MKKLNSNKVLYLTCLENTYKSDIHQNQVLGLHGKGVDYKFLFISPYFLLDRSGFRINRNKYDLDYVKEVKIPIFSANFNLYLFLIPYYLLLAAPILLYYIHKEKTEVVHCRNLATTLLAVFCKVILMQKIKVVCDPRSVYVEECVIIGRFKENGITYRGWKRIERWIYKHSDACCGLSVNFTAYLKQYNSKSYYIPAIVQPSFIFDDGKRKKMREKFKLNANHKVCVYVGSIGLWHSVSSLVSVLKSFKNSLNYDEEMRVVFLTGNNRAIDEVKMHFGDVEILKCGRVAPNEVLDYLMLSDFGVVPGSEKMGNCYELLYATMLSSKAEEFLAAGLPVITHKRIVSLASLITTEHAGLIYDGKAIDKNFAIESRGSISAHFNNMFNASHVVGEDSFYIMALHFIGFKVFSFILIGLGYSLNLAELCPNVNTSIVLLAGYVLFGVFVPLLIIRCYRLLFHYVQQGFNRIKN